MSGPFLKITISEIEAYLKTVYSNNLI